MFGKLIPMRWTDSPTRSRSRDFKLEVGKILRPETAIGPIERGRVWEGAMTAILDELESAPKSVRDSMCAKMEKFIASNELATNADGSSTTGPTTHSTSTVGDSSRSVTLNRNGKAVTVPRRVTDASRQARDTASTIAGMNSASAAFWEEHNRALNGKR